ncbi:MAG TPA: hypothetical protein VLA19_19125 [Herpetosiphonaceae bacterium]|nr:hypothetical protein [Herpetosiphonaceae bacterium]
MADEERQGKIGNGMYVDVVPDITSMETRVSAGYVIDNVVERNTTPSLEQVLAMISRLSPHDRRRLDQHLGVRAHTPRPSLYGVLAPLGSAPSAEDIDETRREMWGNFPRDDF